MGISPLRLFLSSHHYLATYSRCLHWSACAVVPHSTTPLPRRDVPSIVAASKVISPHAGRRSCSSSASVIKEPHVDFDEDAERVAHAPASQGEDRTLPHILVDIAKDKRVVQTFSDASEAAESVVGRRETSKTDTIAFEVFEKINDVQAFLKELNERQKTSGEKKETATGTLATQEPSISRDRSASLSRTASAASLPYSPLQLSEEVSIIIGRDAERKRLDVSMQQVVDVIHDLDRRIERQVPDVDNMRVPKGTRKEKRVNDDHLSH